MISHTQGQAGTLPCHAGLPEFLRTLTYLEGRVSKIWHLNTIVDDCLLDCLLN